MTTTVANLISETKRHLLGVRGSERNKLAEDIAANATALTFTYDTMGVTRGTLIAIDDELFYVWSVDSAAKTAVVEGAQEGSTTAAHSAGAQIEVAPRFSRFEIKQALKEEIASWPSDVFRVSQFPIATSGTIRTYDLTSVGPFNYILNGHYGVTSSDKSNVRPSFSLVRTTAPTLQLTVPPGRARTLTLTLALPFDLDTWIDTTDVEADVGLSPSMLDIPAYGAAWRLMSSKVILRTDTSAQGESRAAEEVTVPDLLNAAKAMQNVRDQRLKEESARLFAQYPRRTG